MKFTCVKTIGVALAVCVLGMSSSTSAARSMTDALWRNHPATGFTYSMPYRLFVPTNYNPSVKYPIMVFLHGAGSRGSDNNLQVVSGASGAYTFTDSANQAKQPCFVMAPQCPATKTWAASTAGDNWGLTFYNINSFSLSEQEQIVLSILDSLKRAYNLDTNRFYISGISMGGYGTWDMIVRNPKMFAAAIPVCGGADTSHADLLTTTPVWCGHGIDDMLVPFRGSFYMERALIAKGNYGRHNWFPLVQHYSWDPMFATRGLFDWTVAKVRPNVEATYPTAMYTATPINGAAPLSVTFNASASTTPNTSITSYAWDFGDGTTGSGASVTHTFDSARIYDVKLTVTDNTGKQNWRVRYVEPKKMFLATPLTGTTAGVKYKYYTTGVTCDGGGCNWKNFATAVANDSGTLPGPTNGMTHPASNFMVRYTGYINVATTGNYTFWVNSDDGSRMYLRDSLIMENSGAKDLGRECVSDVLYLQAGKQPFTIDFVKGTPDNHGANLQLYWEGPGITTKTLIPNSVYVYGGTPTAVVAVQSGIAHAFSINHSSGFVRLAGLQAHTSWQLNLYSVAGDLVRSAKGSNSAIPQLATGGVAPGFYIAQARVGENIQSQRIMVTAP